MPRRGAQDPFHILLVAVAGAQAGGLVRPYWHALLLLFYASPIPVSLTDNLVDVCGFFFRDAPNYQPDSELETFLRGGTPPVYIGFGSIVVDDPVKLTATLVQAVRQAGCRAIISRGWSKLGTDQPPSPDILWLGDCPHEWLFQHVAAVVHHGGAGTTACGLMHARPTAIVPFFGE